MKTLDRLIKYVKGNEYNTREIDKTYLLKMLYEVEREQQVKNNVAEIEPIPLIKEILLMKVEGRGYKK